MKMATTAQDFDFDWSLGIVLIGNERKSITATEFIHYRPNNISAIHFWILSKATELMYSQVKLFTAGTM
jgi:hypothetical protein